MINILFLDVLTPKLRIIIILPIDRPKIIHPIARTTKNQIAFALQGINTV